ncbi:hypothetical protein ABW19_dt0202030 [Dactylella cylindrospora]|nr:hypothetical protein ABW19_dt0202030 [Dactylella cylindrospora]
MLTSTPYFLVVLDYLWLSLSACHGQETPLRCAMDCINGVCTVALQLYNDEDCSCDVWQNSISGCIESSCYSLVVPEAQAILADRCGTFATNNLRSTTPGSESSTLTSVSTTASTGGHLPTHTKVSIPSSLRPSSTGSGSSSVPTASPSTDFGTSTSTPTTTATGSDGPGPQPSSAEEKYVPAASPSGGKPPTGVIAGGVAGGITFLLVSSFLLLWYLRRRRSSGSQLSKDSPVAYTGQSSTLTNPPSLETPDDPQMRDASGKYTNANRRESVVA